MKRLLLPLALLLNTCAAEAIDVQELSYRKTFANLTWNGTFLMNQVRGYNVQLDGLRYKSMYDFESVLAGYELGVAGARGAHADYGSTPYLGMMNYGFAMSASILTFKYLNISLNASLGLEYVSVSSGFIPRGESINIYSNIGPSIHIPVEGGKVGLSFETYFSHLDGARTLEGGAISLFISNEF